MLTWKKELSQTQLFHNAVSFWQRPSCVNVFCHLKDWEQLGFSHRANLCSLCHKNDNQIFSSGCSALFFNPVTVFLWLDNISLHECYKLCFCRWHNRKVTSNFHWPSACSAQVQATSFTLSNFSHVCKGKKKPNSDLGQTAQCQVLCSGALKVVLKIHEIFSPVSQN